MADNPFTLSFGRSPLEAIERPVQTNEIVDTFTSDLPSQQIYIITGVRGVGKTVLMTSVSNRFRTDDSWLVIELNPETDLLQGLAAKLSSDTVCASLFRKAKIDLSFFGFGLSISGESPITDIETALARMFEILKKQGKRILITVDEATNTPSMRVFAAAFQIFVRREFPVFLLMTGLFENIEDLQDEKSLTFLYRAPKLKLSSLNMGAVASRYRSLFHLSAEDASAMADMTKGYPFAFQALGYLTWNRSGDFRGVSDQYRQYLEEFVYDKLWSELSARDKLICYGIACSERGTVQSVREILNLSSDELSPYRKRLIKKGIVDGETRGMLKFTLPLFTEYVKENFSGTV